MKVDVLLRESNFKMFALHVLRETMWNIGVARLVHQTITEFEKGTRIKKDVALLQRTKIDDVKPKMIVYTGKKRDQVNLRCTALRARQ